MLSESLQSIMVSLKKEPSNTLLTLPLMDQLTSEELSQLYTWMLASHLAPNSFNCFKEVFKTKEKQSHLVYFLTNNLLASPELFSTLLTYLNESDFLLLIEGLLAKTKTNSEFTSSLNHVLLIFCSKLYTNQKSETLLHQWYQKSYTKELVYYIVHNPECILSLAQTNSALYAWITWSSYSVALKNRIDAVLNYSTLSADELKQCALIWLEHFRENPQHLYTIFYNLSLSETNRTTAGKENLLILKQACWSLLRPETFYKEEEFLALFYPEKPELFTTISSLVAQKQSHFSLYQQTIWLAKTTEELPKEYPGDQLLAILMHSVHSNSLINWKKASTWLEKQSRAEQLSFLKNLLKKDANPLFRQEAYQLIAQCSQIKIHQNDFNEQELSWLIQYSNADEQNTWLAVIQQGYERGTLNLGLLFFYLPADQQLLEQLLTKDLFSSARVLAALFAEQHLQADSSTHFMSLLPVIRNQDKLWLRQFLNELIGQIHQINSHLMVLFILNEIILNPETALGLEETQDTQIISAYLKLLLSLTKMAQTAAQQTELKQLTFNIFASLINKDEHWARFLFSEPAASSLLAHYLPDSAEKPSIAGERFTELVLNPAFIYLDSKSKEHKGMQHYIHHLLLLAPQQLNNEQFILLFNCLLPENKTTLARTILSLTPHKEIHQKAFSQLTSAMPIDELFTLVNQRKKTPLFKEIVTHPCAYKDLSAIQWYSLFTSLSASEFIGILRDEQIPVSTRSLYLNAFFKAYQENTKLLALQLKQWETTNEHVLVLANFAIDEESHRLLQKIIDEGSYKLILSSERLSLTKFNENSYLHTKTKEALHDGSLLINLKLLQQLPPEDTYTALKQQSKELAKIQALSSLFTPFDRDKSKVLSLLHTARWLHRLPLIHSGLLEIVKFYTQKIDSNDTKIITTLKQTALYQKTLKPILAGKSDETPELLISLYADLQSYCQTMNALAKEHVQQIANVLHNYDKSIATIQLYSAPRLHEHFKPDSTIASFDAAFHSSLSAEDERFLASASSTHQAWIKNKELDPKLFFVSSLTSLIREQQYLEEQEDLNPWLINQILFSSLAINLEELVLDDHLIALAPNKFALYLDAAYEKLLCYQEAWSIFTNLNSTEELFTQLSSFDSAILDQLLSACDNLNLVFLKDFIELIKAIKQLGLNKEQSQRLFLDARISEHQEAHWLLHDLQTMKKRINHAERVLSQLTILSYSYKNNAENNQERLLALTKRGEYIPIPVLAQGINSYVPLFTNELSKASFFLTTVEECIHKAPSLDLINHLDEKAISLIINTALLQAQTYTNLIEQILSSAHSKLCQQQVQLKLNALINPQPGTSYTDIRQLNYQQIKQFEPQQLSTVLSLQRIIYFANPSKELLPFASEECDPKVQYGKKLFCSIACLYQVFITLKKASDAPLDSYFSWLIRFGQASHNNYLTVMEEWEQTNEAKEAVVFFNWLCWKSALFSTVYNDKGVLPKSFITWLSQHKKEDLESNSHLKKLLEYAVEQNQLKAVLAEAFKHREGLNDEQIMWLCEYSLPYTSDEPSLLSQLVDLNSWRSLFLLLARSKTPHFSLLKTALEKEDYWQELLSTETENNFVKQIGTYNFSASQILELIQCTASTQIKAQLILLFLSQPAYLNSVQGQSILNRLADKKEHIPSRLNGLVQQINPKLLSKECISTLLPEAALSVLSCIVHFHRLSTDQVRQLLEKVPQPGTLSYWLNHYAAMPNGFYMLAHLMKIAEMSVYTEIKNLSDTTKEWFMHSIIEHLELFDVNNKLLQETEKEDHLVLALKRYLYGHQHQNHIHFIKQITERLLNKNHVFSLQATQLLIRLHGDPQFKELNQNTAYLVNHNLKTHAQSGSLELFYDLGRANIQSMIQLVPVKPKYPENEKTKGLFAHILTPILAADESHVTLPQSVHPLIDALAEVTPTIKAFDYFLIHYKGSPQVLKKAVQPYLDFYTQKPETTDRLKALYHTSTLMTRQELDPSIKEAIYESFLAYPNLYDEHIAYCMFLFNAQKTVQHFGLRGTKEGYNQVINLCNWALKKLDPKRHEEIITNAKTALFEAKTELAFAEDNGFFSRLFRRFKRCWIYGWTGFFTPKSPVYVLPMTNTTQPPIAQQQSIQPTHLPLQELLTLLEELKKESTLPKLKELILALNQWNFKKHDSEDLQTRYDLHHLFHRLLLSSGKDEALALWLKENQPILIMNRLQLLEYLWANNKPEQALALLKECNDDSPHFHYLTQELHCLAPELISTSASPLPQTEVGKADLLNTATSLAQSAWNWASAFSFFSKPLVEEKPRAPSELPNPGPL